MEKITVKLGSREEAHALAEFFCGRVRALDDRHKPPVKTVLYFTVCIDGKLEVTIETDFYRDGYIKAMLLPREIEPDELNEGTKPEAISDDSESEEGKIAMLRTIPAIFFLRFDRRSRIISLVLDVRIVNCFARFDYDYLGDVFPYDWNKLRKLCNFGKKSYFRFDEFVKSQGVDKSLVCEAWMKMPKEEKERISLEYFPEGCDVLKRLEELKNQ